MKCHEMPNSWILENPQRHVLVVCDIEQDSQHLEVLIKDAPRKTIVSQIFQNFWRTIFVFG